MPCRSRASCRDTAKSSAPISRRLSSRWRFFPRPRSSSTPRSPPMRALKCPGTAGASSSRPERSGARKRRAHRNALARGEIARVDLAAVEFRDELRDVEAQAEVRLRARAFAAPIAAHRDHRSKKLSAHLFRQERPLVLDAELDEAVRDGKRNPDRLAWLAGGCEIHRVRDELVEQLRGKVGRALGYCFLVRLSQFEELIRIGEAVSLDAACYDFAEVEALALDRSESLLQARRLAHASENGAQAPQALFRALDVDAGVGRGELQVFQGRTHHRDRRAQLVRQAARHALQVGVMLRELAEHGREAARQVADLVARVLRGKQT